MVESSGPAVPSLDVETSLELPRVVVQDSLLSAKVSGPQNVTAGTSFPFTLQVCVCGVVGGWCGLVVAFGRPAVCLQCGRSAVFMAVRDTVGPLPQTYVQSAIMPVVVVMLPSVLDPVSPAPSRSTT